MRILFFLMVFLILFPLQILLRFQIFGFQIGFPISTLLILYLGFSENFTRGFFLTCLICIFASALSRLPLGHLLLSNLILFVMLQIIMDQIYTEAYLTKSLWVFPFMCVFETMIRLGSGIPWVFKSFVNIAIESFVMSVFSLPLFLVLDALLDRFGFAFSARRGELTGADFYQVKINQKRYF